MVYEKNTVEDSMMSPPPFTANIFLALATILLFTCHCSAAQDNGWKIGAKIHFEEENGEDYIGLKEINRVTRDALKAPLPIVSESGAANAKILLKKENEDISINHYTEKSNPDVGEEMHATLLYTSPRGFHPSETLAQVCPTLFTECSTAPEIEVVSRKYSAIIKPSWCFQIAEIVFTKNDQGPSFIMAKLLFEGRESIYLGKDPISAGLHMTLVNCTDNLILSDTLVTETLVKRLNDHFKGKFIKIAAKGDVADIEFGQSGQPWRIRAGEKVVFKR